MEDYSHRQFYSLGVGSGTAPQWSLCAVSNEGRDINEGWLEQETSFMLGRLDLGLPGWREKWEKGGRCAWTASLRKAPSRNKQGPGRWARTAQEGCIDYVAISIYSGPWVIPPWGSGGLWVLCIAPGRHISSVIKFNLPQTFCEHLVYSRVIFNIHVNKTWTISWRNWLSGYWNSIYFWLNWI